MYCYTSIRYDHWEMFGNKVLHLYTSNSTFLSAETVFLRLKLPKTISKIMGKSITAHKEINIFLPYSLF